MGARRVPHERARWFSAVLIVAAIAGASVVLRKVPVLSVRPRLLAAAHPFHTFLAPPLVPASMSRVTPLTLADGGPSATAARAAAASIPAGEPASIHVPAVPVRSEDGTIPILADAVVAARKGDVFRAIVAVPPVMHRGAPPLVPTADAVPLALHTAGDGAPGLVEIPALAVTRAVGVAGRGIRTGLRATTAVFRAAF